MTLPGAPTAFVVPVAGPTLAGMPYPGADVLWSEVAAAGVVRVLDLTGHPCGYDCSPLERSQFGLQDLVGGGPPRDEEQERDLIHAAVDMIGVTRTKQGGGVLVHCDGGRGRTGTVLGAYLVTLGYAPVAVSSWLSRVYERRGRPGWPESQWQSDLLEEFR